MNNRTYFLAIGLFIAGISYGQARQPKAPKKPIAPKESIITAKKTPPPPPVPPAPPLEPLPPPRGVKAVSI